ncbi:rCG39726 [Rattus norvegicus]|uniref:RCG39726 n=1 Tax=Rattus norvegicus TaxID=10116 RepID=A6I676_RAT|nr:rCG39726 [Rattus norvegicus]
MILKNYHQIRSDGGSIFSGGKFFKHPPPIPGSSVTVKRLSPYTCGPIVLHASTWPAPVISRLHGRKWTHENG